MNCQKALLMIIVTVFLCTVVTAKLSEEQLNEAVSKVQGKVPNCAEEEIRSFILNQDCASNTIQSPVSFTCGDEVSHKYECRQGIHYLDEEVISILSSKTDIHNTEIRDSNFMQTGDIIDSNVDQTIDKSDNSWFLNIFVDLNFYIGITFTIALSLIIKFLFQLKIVKKKK